MLAEWVENRPCSIPVAFKLRAIGAQEGSISKLVMCSILKRSSCIINEASTPYHPPKIWTDPRAPPCVSCKLSRSHSFDVVWRRFNEFPKFDVPELNISRPLDPETPLLAVTTMMAITMSCWQSYVGKSNEPVLTDGLSQLICQTVGRNIFSVWYQDINAER